MKSCDGCEEQCLCDTIDIGNSGAEKHTKYKHLYGSDEVFFGLGIENEVYLELEKGIEFTEEKFLKNRKRERYSVDYNTSYVIKNLLIIIVNHNNKFLLLFMT